MTKQKIKTKSIINSNIFQVNGNFKFHDRNSCDYEKEVDWGELCNSMISLEKTLVYGEDDIHLEDVFVYQDAELKLTANLKWKNIGDLKEYLLAADYENLNTDKKPIIIYGDFGIGKSSFLKMFTSLLIRINFKYIPVFIPLRELPLYDKEDLVRAIKKYLQIYGNFNFKSEKKILFILDGFDELNLYKEEEGWIKKSFEQLLSLLRYKNICTIISSRPILFLKEEDNIPISSPIFRIKEFNEEQIDKWIKNWKIIPKNKNSKISLDGLKLRKLLDLTKNPLLLYMTAKIFDSELLNHSSYSKGLIYKLFYDWTIKGKYKDDKQSHRIPQNYRNVLQNIAMTIRYIGSNEEFINYDSLKKNIVEFQKDILEENFFNLTEIVLVAHFFKIHEKNELKYIEFSHKSFREYLIAEKFFYFFQDCLENNEFDLSKWISLGRHLPSKEEILFLKDLLYTLNEKDLLWLYNKFTLHTPMLIATGHLSGILDKVNFPEKSEICSIYYRSINLSTLAFILSNIIFFKLMKNWDTLLINNDNLKGRRPLLNYIYHLCHSQPQITKSDELIKEYQKNWSTTKHFLSGINLSSLNLDGVDFSNAEMDDVNLNNASIRRCTFVNSRLILTDLSYAICDGSDFSRSYCHNTKFINTYLNQVDFKNAQIYYAKFINTEFNYVDFTGTIFEKCKFEDCRFNNTIINKDKMSNCEGFLIS